ncbi:MAG TPA: shikimate dehydrogenase [Gemmatimonadaceae bacterium]|nr:shikimate dehydrogenase [Gemmatimonadaceae bacterium]
MRRAPGRLVLVGHPVAHSLSPALQNAALRYAGLPITYEAIDVKPEALESVLKRLVAARAAGNVTIPHKEAMGRHCSRPDAIARRVNAVNTFRVAEDGELEGTNTDVGGFDALAREAGALRTGARVALLGAGGSAAAVLTALERWSGATVSLFNRSTTRAAALAARFPIVSTVAATAAEAVRNATVVVNATSLGLKADDAFPVAIESLRADAVVLDLVYQRRETAWVRTARQHGHSALDGLCMLLEQGALAFEWWLGIAAPRDVMREALVTAAGM